MRRKITIIVGSAAASVAVVGSIVAAGAASASPYDDWSYSMLSCLKSNRVEAGPYTPDKGWVKTFEHTNWNDEMSRRCAMLIGPAPAVEDGKAPLEISTAAD